MCSVVLLSTLCFGLAGKDHTFDGRAFYVLLEKIQVSGFVLGYCLAFGLVLSFKLWI